MTQVTSQVAGARKWHVYRQPQKPNIIMVIGSILTKPDDLETSLNFERGIESFPQDKRRDETHAVRRVIHTEMSADTGGELKAMLPILAPVVNAGAGLGAKNSKSDEATVEALDIHAESIMPGTANPYIDKALLTHEVAEYVKKGMFTRRLYLIVGVATCKRLFIGDSSAQEQTFSAKGDLGLPPAGAEAEARAFANRNALVESELEIQEECAFAYRVREFQYSRLRRRITGAKDITEGSVFGGAGGRADVPLTTAEVEAEYHDVPKFDYFESEDEEVDTADVLRLQVLN